MVQLANYFPSEQVCTHRIGSRSSYDATMSSPILRLLEERGLPTDITRYVIRDFLMPNVADVKENKAVVIDELKSVISWLPVVVRMTTDIPDADAMSWDELPYIAKPSYISRHCTPRGALKDIFRDEHDDYMEYCRRGRRTREVDDYLDWLTS